MSERSKKGQIAVDRRFERLVARYTRTVLGRLSVIAQGVFLKTIDTEPVITELRSMLASPVRDLYPSTLDTIEHALDCAKLYLTEQTDQARVNLVEALFKTQDQLGEARKLRRKLLAS